MKDKNFVFLEGEVAEDYRYMKTKDGKEFATFTLRVNSFDKHMRDATEINNHVHIRIMVFDNKQVDYLKGKKPHAGTRVSIMGRLNCRLNEYKGVSRWQNDVIVRDIHIIKT